MFAEKSRELSDPNFDFEAGQKRWEYAFRVLARVLSSYFTPMILVLDDLQWADVSSLEVIDFLMCDAQNSNQMMIIGCFRSNEVDDTHALSLMVEDLRQKNEKMGFNITDIELGSLALDEVNDIIMKLMAIDDDGSRTLGLAQICLKRTLGNPFFLIEFLSMLEYEGLLSFNLCMFKWVWDEKEIEDQTMSTANVVELLKAKMEKLPEEAQTVLQYAACLGSTFRVRTVSLIWQKRNTGRVSKAMELLVNDDIIEACGPDRFRWVHDKVQEAALMIGDADKPSFRFEIGSTLYDSLREEELEELLFEVTDLINAVTTRGRFKYAELNLRAAEKARFLSAFKSSLSYVSKGISFLPTDKWVSHRVMTLRFYTIGTEMSLALGQMADMERYGQEVLSQTSISTLDKIPVYMAKCHKLTNVDRKHPETVDFCLGVLKELGVDMMVGGRKVLPLRALVSFTRTVKTAKTTPKDVYSALETMSDPRQQAIMKILSRLNYACFMCNDRFLQLLAITRMVKTTLRFGVSAMAGFAFASLAMVTRSLQGDFGTACFFAEMALLASTRESCQQLCRSNNPFFGVPLHLTLEELPKRTKNQCCKSPFFNDNGKVPEVLKARTL